jgi:zinc and cadmium transporter
MPIVMQVLICALAGGLLSLIGGLILLASKKRVRAAEYATAFAAGALLAAALIDMLPEALEDSSAHLVTAFVLAGIIVFFLLELFLNWFHRHSSHGKSSTDPVVPMLIFGDVIHNFIDGIAIAAAFLISPTSGIIVTLAVAAHEIPQEVGHFGLLLHKGVSRKKVLIINVLSTLATVVSAVTFFTIGNKLDISLSPLLGLVAGFFIYIAVSDIIPSIHSDRSQKTKIKKAITLLAGIVIVWLAIVSLHSIAH